MSISKPRSIARIALPLSLALNVLVIGLVIGALLRGPDHAPRSVDLSLGPLTRALDEADRAALGERLRGDLEAGRRPPPPGMAARAGELRAVLAALRAEPFDAEALTARLDAQRARARDWADAGQAGLVAHLSQMSPAQRAAFADRLEAEFRSRGERLPGRAPDRHR